MFERLKNIITRTSTIDDEILKLLTDTTIGTNGAKYQHLHTPKKIHQLKNPIFITIRRHNKAVGNMAVCERHFLVNKQQVKSLYVRYFAFDKIYHASGKPKQVDRESIFDLYLKKLFTTSNVDVNEPEFESSMYWAFIDPLNNKSWNMSNRFGFETIGYFSTYAFSRFYPKKHKQVRQINSNEIDKVWQKTQYFYKGFNFVSNTHLFKDNNYFVYVENDKIVAGIQVFDIHWRIDAMPGTKGKLMVKTLPYIPFMNRIINPKNYHFLATEGLFWEAGYEHVVEDLLNAVLAEKGKNSMLFWFDDADEKLPNHFKNMDLGILQKLKSDNSIEIVAKFNNFSTSLKEQILAQKNYISGFDTT